MSDKRERLFRAKHVHILPQNKHLDGLWVYGYLCDKDHINVSHEDEYGGTYTSETLVHPDTVCQYIGLDDRNGKKIFEGDIVRVEEDDEDEILVVEWDPDTARFVMDGDGWTVDFDSYNGYDCEVIGNIFDNPELVNGWG